MFMLVLLDTCQDAEQLQQLDTPPAQCLMAAVQLIWSFEAITVADKSSVPNQGRGCW